MATITYTVSYNGEARQAVEQIPDDLVPFYRDKPGYTVVVDEAAAEELKGDDLDQAARNVGVSDPTHTPADEKRAVVVAATQPDPDAVGVPLTLTAGEAILTAAGLADVTDSRDAADTEE